MLTIARLWQRIGLGLFIVWQLFYLAVANSLETVEIVTHRFPETSAAITTYLDNSREGKRRDSLASLSSLVFVVDKYGQLTEQPQRWSLFAPNINDQTSFLACEFRWEGQEESVWLLSDDEPRDTSDYFRFLGNRVRSLEQNLAISFAFDAGETEQQARERWAGQIQEKLSRDFDILIAWSALRVNEFQKDFPEAAYPDEVILHVRGYEIAAPDGAANTHDGIPYCLALARWCPAAEYPADVLPIEAFNPVTEQFVFQAWAAESEP